MTIQADSNVIKHVDYFAGLFNFNDRRVDESFKRVKLDQAAESEASSIPKTLDSNEANSNFKYTADLREFSKIAVKAIVQYIYTGEFMNDAESDIALIEVYVLADYICLEGFRDQLVQRIMIEYCTVQMIMDLLLELKDSALPLRD